MVAFWQVYAKVWRSSDKSQAASDREKIVQCEGLPSGKHWHDHSYTAGIPLLAHSLSVKFCPCLWSCSSPSCLNSCVVSMCGHLHVATILSELGYTLRLSPGWFSIFLVSLLSVNMQPALSVMVCWFINHCNACFNLSRLCCGSLSHWRYILAVTFTVDFWMHVDIQFLICKYIHLTFTAYIHTQSS